jgi:HSP20 family protein
VAQPLQNVFLDLHRQVDEIFDKLIFRPWAIREGSTLGPPVDLHETADAYFLEIDLPGVAPEEVRLLVSERVFTVTGERTASRPEGAIFSHRERRSGKFQRSVNLPEAIDPTRAHAEYRHGTYRVHLPKKQPGAVAASGVQQSYSVLEVSVR